MSNTETNKLIEAKEKLSDFGNTLSNPKQYSNIISFIKKNVFPLFNDSSYFEEIAYRSYNHPNGWSKIVLLPANNQNEYELRVHFYSKTSNDCSIHNHAWSFYSLILNGELEHEVFDIYQGDSFEIMNISPLVFNNLRKESKYLNNERSHVGFKNILTHYFSKKQCYHLDSSVFHRVKAIENNTVSLVLQKPFENNGSFIGYPRNEKSFELKQPKKISQQELNSYLIHFKKLLND